MKYVRALDGVRGIAILLVILFHQTFLSCGWAGVQLFFVLSGFLITSILVSDGDLPLKFYLQRFYWRRTLRIFPLYFGYLAVLAICYGLTGKPEVFGRCWQYLATYTLNFQRLQRGFPNNPFFGHFWSLAVEEQFYLVWPLLIFLLRPRGRQILIGGLLVLCPVIRALTAYFAAGISHNQYYIGQAVYSFTPGQLDAFAAGAALVVFQKRLPRKPLFVLAVATVALVACGQAAAFLLTGRLALNTSFGYEINMLAGGQHIWGYTLINIWSAALILAAIDGNAVSRWLSGKALVFIGRISYGMYLFHLVVKLGVTQVLGERHSFANLAAFAVYFCVLVAVCFLSFRFYESFFLSRKDRFFSRRDARRANQASV